MGEGRSWLVVWDPRWKCLEVSGDTNTTCFEPYHCFFSATALCVSLRQDEAWSPGESKGASVQNRENYDLGFQSCCVPLDHSFSLSPMDQLC